MKRVLVVDDDQDILTLVEMVLSMNNFKVQAISRWEEIKDKIKSFQPDLILLDVALVGADGREICKQIKTASETKHIPVILFSAYSEVANSLDESMAQGFIAKPFDISHLVETLNSNLN